MLRIIPSFCFGMGVLNIGSRDTFARLDGEDEAYDALSLDSAGADILMMGINTFFYLFLTIVAEIFETNPRLR